MRVIEGTSAHVRVLRAGIRCSCMMARISAASADADCKTGGHIANYIGAKTSTCLVNQRRVNRIVKDLEVTLVPRGNIADILLCV